MGVIQWEHWCPFSPINISKKRGSFSERAFWKWGSLGESKMWKIKRGSFSDRRFENGGQCDRTYPSHIFRECPWAAPPPHLRKFYIWWAQHAISLPIFVKHCLGLILTPNYWGKTWLSTEKPLLKMREQKPIKKKKNGPSFSSFKKVMTHHHILPPPPS